MTKTRWAQRMRARRRARARALAERDDAPQLEHRRALPPLWRSGDRRQGNGAPVKTHDGANGA